MFVHPASFRILANNAVVKQVGISSLLCVQIITYNIHVHLKRVIKLSVYYYAGFILAYAGIIPADHAIGFATYQNVFMPELPQ